MQKMNGMREEFPFLKERRHRIALVGAGGKTTLMYALADDLAGRGVRTLVTTTTHIRRPQERYLARTPGEARRIWNRGSYAVAAADLKNGKMAGLSRQDWETYAGIAETVLVEADGAKGMPCKVPAGHEPVIPESCDIVIGVMGMDALGHPLEQVCFRLEKAVGLLRTEPGRILDEEMAARILASREGVRKGAGQREYYAVLNKCDTEARLRSARKIREYLREWGIGRCVFTSFQRKEPDR